MIRKLITQIRKNRFSKIGVFSKMALERYLFWCPMTHSDKVDVPV